MRMDKLTSKFQLALADAQSLATGLDHQLIEPAHVMVALLDQEGGASRHLLTKAGVRVKPLRSALGERLDSLPRMADFALWATACETALWTSGTFGAAYAGNRDEAVDSERV